MNWNKRLRQIHRWLSIVFTAVVIAMFAALGKQPAQVYFLPLLPLALLLLTGPHLFAQPYAFRWRSGSPIGG